MTVTINTVDAKDQFAEIINQVAHNKERVILSRRGKDIAVIISMEDYKLLLTAQDKSDVRESMEALKEAREKGTHSLKELKEIIGS